MLILRLKQNQGLSISQSRVLSFNVVVDRGQDGHCDWSAAAQPRAHLLWCTVCSDNCCSWSAWTPTSSFYICCKLLCINVKYMILSRFLCWSHDISLHNNPISLSLPFVTLQYLTIVRQQRRQKGDQDNRPILICWPCPWFHITESRRYNMCSVSLWPLAAGHGL